MPLHVFLETFHIQMTWPMIMLHLEHMIGTTDVCIVRSDKGRTNCLTLDELAELMAQYQSKYQKFACLEAM